MTQIDLRQTDYYRECLEALPNIGYGPASLVMDFLGVDLHPLALLDASEIIKHFRKVTFHELADEFTTRKNEYLDNRQDANISYDGVDLDDARRAFGRSMGLHWNEYNNLDFEIWGILKYRPAYKREHSCRQNLYITNPATLCKRLSPRAIRLHERADRRERRAKRRHRKLLSSK